MPTRRSLLAMAAGVGLVLQARRAGAATPKPGGPAGELAAALGPGFASERVRTEQGSIHVIRGGDGPAVILLHGFPQDWYAFHNIMPRLAQHFNVIAIDLRGVGASRSTTDDFSPQSLARDVADVARRFELRPAYVVGHDIGGLVAYAYAREFPEATRGLMILDVPVPGTATWTATSNLPVVWHFGFLQTPGLAEGMLPGRQAIFFREGFFNRALVNRAAIGEKELAHYAAAYSSPAQIHAALQYYRSFDSAARYNENAHGVLIAPIVLAGGEKGFGPMLPGLAGDLARLGCQNVHIEVVQNAGHYVIADQPATVAALIERYAEVI